MTEPFELADPERTLAVAYAPPSVRSALSTLFAIDERLGGIVARTTEPAIGLMRLVWWRDSLEALDVKSPPAEPLLAAAAATLLPRGIDGAMLAAMTAGWEILIDDPLLEPESVDVHAAVRGRGLLAMAARLLGADRTESPRIDAAGELWARADLARHLTGDDRAGAILESARPWSAPASGRWPKPLRPVGILSVLAAEDVARGIGRLRPAASRGRLLRVLRHQLTGW